MNTLIVNPSVLAGGAQKIMLSLAYHLERLGHHVIIYTTLVDWEGLPPEFRTLRVICSRHQVLRPGGAMTRYRNVPIIPLAVRLLQIRRELRVLIKRHEIDVVLAHQPPSAWSCSFLDVPVVWNCFEPIALWQSRRLEYFSLRPTTSNPILRILEELYEWSDRAIVRCGIPYIFVLSKRLQRQVASLYRRDSEVFYPGSDCEVLPTHSSRQENGHVSGRNEGFTVLQVGQFHANKNHLVTLEVAKRIKEKSLVKQFRVLFAGEGDYEPLIRRKIAEFSLQEHVEIVGSFPINDPSMTALYRKADVLVFPSTTQSWGLVPFEALANGVVPIVSTDCGAAEVIREQDIGYVTEPTVDSFYHALMYVYDHPEERQEKVERGRRFVLQELTYANYARKIHERLTEILKANTNARR